MTALKIKTVADHGYADAAANPSKFPAGLFSICTGSYDIPNAFCEVDGVYTNKPPGGIAYRCSFRVTEAVHAIERMVDVLAQELKMDPAALADEELHPAGEVPVPVGPRLGVRQRQLSGGPEDGDGDDRLRGAAQGAGREAQEGRAHGHRDLELHRDRRRRAVQALRHPRHQDVRLLRAADPPDRQGDGALRHEVPGPGPRDDVRADHRRGARDSRRPTSRSRRATRTPRPTDSAPTPAARRRRPARRARWRRARSATRPARSRRICSRSSEDDLEWEPGKFSVKGAPQKSKTIQDIAFAAYTNHPPGMEAGLEAVNYYDPPNLTFPFGSYICVVDIDRGTGEVKIRRFVADRRLRQHHQPDDRRRPDPRRPLDGHGAGAHGGDHLRRERQQPGRQLHGLPGADVDGDAELGDGQDGHALAAPSLRREGRRRVGDRRRAAGDRQRRRRCARASRGEAHRHPDHAGEGVEHPEGEGGRRSRPSRAGVGGAQATRGRGRRSGDEAAWSSRTKASTKGRRPPALERRGAPLALQAAAA